MALTEATLKKIKPGATVRVFEAFKEGDKERSMRFEGLVLARKHGSEPGASFTVRATVAGVGVEKTFSLFSPAISKVDIISSPNKVKRAKLYYIRDLSRKAIRRKTSIDAAAAKKESVKAVPEAKKTEETKK